MPHNDYDYFDDSTPARSTNEADVEIIRLYDEDGNELPFRKVYEANIRKKIYYILLPQFEIPGNGANQALVFEVTRKGGGLENYNVVVDDFIVNEVFDAYNASLSGEDYHEVDEKDVDFHRAIESRYPLADEPTSRLVDLPIPDVFEHQVQGMRKPQPFKKLSGILFRGHTFLLSQPQFYAGPGEDPDPVVFEMVPDPRGQGLALNPIGYDDDLYYTCLAIYIRKTSQQNHNGSSNDDYFGGGSDSSDDYF